MAMGMTWDQYWYQDVTMVRAFRKAHKLRLQQSNTDAWLSGKYVYDAVCAASPLLHAFAKRGTKASPYTKEPYQIYGEEKQQTEEEKQKIVENERLKARLYFENWARAVANDMKAKEGR